MIACEMHSIHQSTANGLEFWRCPTCDNSHSSGNGEGHDTDRPVVSFCRDGRRPSVFVTAEDIAERHGENETPVHGGHERNQRPSLDRREQP